MNPNGEYDFLLAIPCYRENERLPPFLEELVNALQSRAFRTRIQIVDDGSPEPDRSQFIAWVERFRESRSELVAAPLAYQKNRGKGYAIRSAWKEASARFFAFIDADGSISGPEAAEIMQGAYEAKQDKCLYLATRDNSSSPVSRSALRKLISHLFNLSLRLRYDIEISDTQCGFKIIPNAFHESWKDHFYQERFAFDIELLLKAKESGLVLEEIPVRWIEKSAGKLRFSDGISLFWNVWTKRI